ncbi:1-deoxy-D-xylulose-5-phosphate reductoisomerase [uncultured Propionivibrio sp.]|uniref:1-deoxy-D-xylulose-5-phosphate reductoisomerase n=1 Tax=uncultured Propionivibrio sp. TaxID=426737 RepID=UPI0029C0A9CD|nr:1-deoxy-D-xylulose-5-phosphate reductoisomerase [uncultured Propionivibrio sp.]
MTPRHLTVLGSTGSIGVSTLDVVRRHPDRYRVVALCAHRQVDRLFEQCVEFRPRYAVVRDAALAAALRDRLQDAGCTTEIAWGEEALVRMSALPEVDTVMAAIVGAAGLKPALAAAQTGKRVLLANKEALVMAGAVFMRTVRENNAVLLPIDSEHNAIFQSLPVDYSGDLSRSGVARILLTASGGPFRSADRAKLERVTPDQACAHPNWVMGRKISVDSATLMNKGLEVIEAHWLFNVPPELIQVVVHPQSVIHSMVEYIDGSVLAELGTPDMRTPIAHALAYPERIVSGVASLDLFKIASLSFEQPDFERFPCLGLAYEALKTGGTAPAILNAANEIAVAAFLAEEIRFTEIPKIIDATMRGVSVSTAEVLEDVLAADAAAREYAGQMCRQAGDL